MCISKYDCHLSVTISPCREVPRFCDEEQSGPPGPYITIKSGNWRWIIKMGEEEGANWFSAVGDVSGGRDRCGASAAAQQWKQGVPTRVPTGVPNHPCYGSFYRSVIPSIHYSIRARVAENVIRLQYVPHLDFSLTQLHINLNFITIPTGLPIFYHPTIGLTVANMTFTILEAWELYKIEPLPKYLCRQKSEKRPKSWLNYWLLRARLRWGRENWKEICQKRRNSCCRKVFWQQPLICAENHNDGVRCNAVTTLEWQTLGLTGLLEKISKICAENHNAMTSVASAVWLACLRKFQRKLSLTSEFSAAILKERRMRVGYVIFLLPACGWFNQVTAFCSIWEKPQRL